MHYEPRYRPVRSLGLLSRLLQDQELEGLLNPAATNSHEPERVSDWLPAVDIREEDDRFELSADLPGVDPENITVTMEDGVLSIQGSRNSQVTDETDGYQRYERVSGKFLRRFTLPDTANDEEISATTKQGVLTVSIPKQARPQVRKIDVKST
ncbi:MAG: Hsp20/alpha crystallin family protein [Gammaproteobacteria bacterium]|nr:MAG: Hsp20/alpha crystallin family protein [Gammaproteobacteria bacterium]